MDPFHKYQTEDKKIDLTWLVIRAVVSVCLCFPFFLLKMGLFFSTFSLGLQAVLAFFIQSFCAWPFYVNTWRDLKHFSLNGDMLITLGINAAYFYGFYTIWVEPNRGIFFETSSFLITCILLGRVAQQRLVYRAKSTMRAFLSKQPKNACIKFYKEYKRISLEEVCIGDLFIVKSGETVPLDGEVMEGSCAISEYLFSGETAAVEKQKGSFIFAGTVNLHGTVIAKTQKVGSDSFFGQMICLLEKAYETKAFMEKLTAKISIFLIPFVFVISLLTLCGWWFFTHNFNEGIVNAISVLLIACPSIFVSSSLIVTLAFLKCLQKGILFSDFETMKKAGKIQQLIIDKSCIVSEGILQVEKVHLDERYYPIVKTLCERSEHPTSKGVLEFLKTKSTISLRMLAIRSTPGKGISGYFDARNYYSGCLDFLEEKGIRGELFVKAQAKENGILLGLGTEKLALGYFVLSEPIRKESRKIIRSLKQMGIKTIFTTNDRVAVAEKVASDLDVDFYEAEVLPEQKVECVKEAKKTGKIVAKVGDSSSDTTSLAAADIGFAMNIGKNLSTNSSFVRILSADLGKVLQAIVISKEASKKMKQNVFFAFCYSILMLPLAAFGFFHPVVAAALMSLSFLSVTLNAIFLQKKEFY